MNVINNYNTKLQYVAYFQEFSRGKKFILKDISHEKQINQMEF